MRKRSKAKNIKILAALYVFVFTLSMPLAWCADGAGAQSSLLNDEGVAPQIETDRSYVLQPGDHLNLKIYPEDEYIKGGPTEVSSEGNITIALAGKISVGGKTVVEAEKAITTILATDYLVSPEVVIQVLQYKKKTAVILGQVRKPGTYDFPAGEDKFSLLQLISVAGGFSEIANIKKIKIVRQNEAGKKIIQADAESIISGKSEDVQMENGDVVNVSESLF